jgi:hypothetical protein
MNDSYEGAFERHDAMPAVTTGAMCMQQVQLNTIMRHNQINFICKDNASAGDSARSPFCVSPGDYPLG